MSAFQTIEWHDGIVRMLDQRRLPHETVYNDYSSYQEVAKAIHEMVIRGAPAIGAAAAYGMALVPYHTTSDDPQVVRQELLDASKVLRKARPTAVKPP